jgi:ribosome maturation factor RimP
MTGDSLLETTHRLVAELGFELVDFRKVGPPQNPLIQVRIDRPDSRPGAGVTAGDCTLVSRALERWLDGTAGVGLRYGLTVSSPGFDRPVRFPAHWRRFVGRTVRLRAAGLAGRPRAEIVAVPDDAHVELRLPDGVTQIVALDRISEATLESPMITVPSRPGKPKGRR